jgi:acyl-CoA dehydrogenase family member 9
VLFERHTAGLASAVERVLRKHGAEIDEKQFVQKRVAEAAIDLYALAATISRTTRAVEARGEESARREIELCQGFAVLAEKRLEERLGDMERDSDELHKSIAARAYEDGGYPLDIL